ncbi:hypothetical protein A4X09_0g1969 [Tilletia walkeri]|uniref:Uncharacterized protein n=1 Tax=Tilletia walkeri TaxID=117179 RepID=A0A8X7NAN4_9BASI|nr:hypothetical protein A4X09_0g1969 [Tilletia walkeri]
MDATKPIGDDLFAPAMHSTTPAGAANFTNDDDDVEVDTAALSRTYHGADVGSSSGPSAATFGGRPAPGSRLSQISIPQFHLSPSSSSAASSQQQQQQQQQQQHISPTSAAYGLNPSLVGAVKHAGKPLPPPPPPENVYFGNLGTSGQVTRAQDPFLPGPSGTQSIPQLWAGGTMSSPPRMAPSSSQSIPFAQTPQRLGPGIPVPGTPAELAPAAAGLAGAAAAAAVATTMEPPSYASLPDTQNLPPNFADESGATPATGGRFPRWRGWLEKRDLERRYAAMEEAAQAAAEGRVARKKSWGAGVHDADALPYDGEDDDEDDDEEYEEEEMDEDEYEDDSGGDEDDVEQRRRGSASARAQGPTSSSAGLNADNLNSRRAAPRSSHKRRRTGPPSPLHTHHFGSRFLPHLPSQPLCAVFLDIPPKPLSPISAVAAAPSLANDPNPATPGGARLWNRGAKPNEARIKPRAPQRRTVILIGTAEGLFAVELARPARRRRRRRKGEGNGIAGQSGTRSMSDGEMETPTVASARNPTLGRGAESDGEEGQGADGLGDETEDQGSGWNGGIRVVQVWSGLGVFQLSILRSRPPPSAIFGPDGVTMPSASRRSGNAFMGGFGVGFSPINSAPAQGGEGAPSGAILLALTAPAPPAYAPGPPLTRVSPFPHALLESSATGAGVGHHYPHHHHHSRSHSHAHEDALNESSRGGKALALGMNLGRNVAPGSFGTDSGGGPGRAVPTTLSSSLAGHVASLPAAAAAGINASDASASAAAAATLATLSAGGTGSPNGQVRMWNLEALRGCVAWALDSQRSCDPLDLSNRDGLGAKKSHKQAKNRLSRAFKKVFGVLGDSGSPSKAASRPGLSDSVSVDAVETLATSNAAKLGKGKDREGRDREEERRRRAGQRTASDGSVVSSTWTVIDNIDATSPTSVTTHAELESESGHGTGYEDSVRSFGTFGRSFDEDRRAMSPLSPEVGGSGVFEDPALVAQEASRKAALRLALSSVVIPAGSGSASTAGTFPGPSLPGLEDDRNGAQGKGKERVGFDRSGNASAGGNSGAGNSANASSGSGIGPVTSSSGSPKPVLFYAVHEAAPGAKGAGTWYLALATTKTVTVYEARPPKNDQRTNSFLPMSLQRGGPSGGQSWAQDSRASAGGMGEARSWSLLRELYTPQAPKAISFAQASTTDIPLTAKEKGAGMRSDSILQPQFSGGMAGPRGWMGADLSLLVTFGNRAVVIRLTDLNVRDFDLASVWNPPPQVWAQRTSPDLRGSALAEETSNLTLDPHSSASGRGASSASHHRRTSSSSQSQMAEKQNWIGMQTVDVKILLKQSHTSNVSPELGGLEGGVPMAASYSAETTFGRSGGEEAHRTLDPRPPAVFTSVLSPNAASGQRQFDFSSHQTNTGGATALRTSTSSTSTGESESTNEDDDSADGNNEDFDRSEIVYTATGRRAVALHDRSVHVSSGSRSDPTLTVVDRAGPASREAVVPPKRNTAVRRRDREKQGETDSPGKLVSTSIVLITKGPTTQILPLPLPADLCKPKALDVLSWSGVPNAVNAWARVVGLERERTTGAVSTADIGSRSNGRTVPRRGSGDDLSGGGATNSIILHLSVTAVAFMASKVESQRTRVRVHVSLSFPLLRDAEIELLPVLDALLPTPVPTAVRLAPHQRTNSGAATAQNASLPPEMGIKMKLNPRAYAAGVSRANDLCICADPPRVVGSNSSTFDASRRRSLAEPRGRAEQEFEYLSGSLIGLPHRGGVRAASIAAVDVSRPWEMRGDGGVLGWDWRGGRDYRLFFVGAEI